jgi:hypothetical protein
VRANKVVDAAELWLLTVIRCRIRSHDDNPCNAHIDALLDERSMESATPRKR